MRSLSVATKLRRRWLALSVVVAAATVAAVGPLPASANSTETSIVQVDVTDTISGTCPFDIVEQQTGSFKVTDFFDENGNIVKTILTPIAGSFVTTWSANGITATSHGTPVVTITYDREGFFSSSTDVGVVFHFVVPGTGVVFAQTGRLVFEEGGITFQAGQNQLVEGDTATLCAALS
jgi:hypothetical protein